MGDLSGAPATAPLHIVVVAYGCNPERGSEPGTGWGWVEALWRQGHLIDVLTVAGVGSEDAITRRLSKLGAGGSRIRVHFVPHPTDLGWTARLPAAPTMFTVYVRYTRWQQAALRMALDVGLADADVIHHVSLGSFTGASEFRRLGPPLVFGPVGGGQTAPFSFLGQMGRAAPAELVRTLVWRHAMSWRPSVLATARQAAVIIAANSDTRRLAERRGAQRTHLMCDFGTGRGDVQSAGTTLARPAERSVLWVGRLVAIKAPWLAVEALAELNATGEHARLIMVGDGPLRDRVAAAACRAGVADSVHLTGQLSHEETLAHYQAAGVMLFTSLRDTFGVQNLEAWERGLPSVFLNHHGVADFAPPNGSLPVPLGRPRTLPRRLAKALRTVLDDPQRRDRMAESARVHADRMSWAAKAVEAERIYRQSIPV
jgi:glycosyltransferase involved in cell wall biosynthesis